jgi:hypothetical protein
LASTFADQVVDAAQWLRAGNNPDFVDMQAWDVSIRAVAHYPTVLYMMNDRIDWTAALGQAYVNQSTDVMLAVQHLRRMAQSAGNLESTPQQQVIVEGGFIYITPHHPRYIYVPVYDPRVIYYRHRPTGYRAGALLTFSAGFAIGVWLNHDLDWGRHRIYYHGWQGGGWIARSRPNVHITNVYVNENRRNIVVNRTIVKREVNYSNVNRYSSVHPDVRFGPGNVHKNSPARGPQTKRQDVNSKQNQAAYSPAKRPQIGRAGQQQERGQSHVQKAPSGKGEKNKGSDKKDERKQRTKGGGR